MREESWSWQDNGKGVTGERTWRWRKKGKGDEEGKRNNRDGDKSDRGSSSSGVEDKAMRGYGI